MARTDVKDQANQAIVDYRDLVAAGQEELTTVELDHHKKYGTINPREEFLGRSSIPSDLDLELTYRDPVVTPVVIHAEELYAELLDEMTAIEPSVRPRKSETVDGKTVFVETEDEYELHRREHAKSCRRRQGHAELTCRYQWNDDFFESNSTPYLKRRGRIATGPLLNYGGDTLVFTTTQSYVPARTHSESVVTDKGGREWEVRYTVFLREHVGSDRRGYWTWQYHAFKGFGNASEALEWMDRLTQSLRNEIQLEDHWYSAQFTPGEALPYDPYVLASVVDHTPSEAAESYES